MPDREPLSDQKAREGFGPDACDQDRVDGPTRDRLQRLYGSIDLLPGGATSDGQYEDIKGVETIVGDLREERDRLRAENERLKQFAWYGKADRSVILRGLAKLEFGYAREVEARIEATKCKGCDGTGFSDSGEETR